jgi:hypothetical protein
MQKFKDKDFANCDVRHNGYVEMRVNHEEIKGSYCQALKSSGNHLSRNKDGF